MPSQFEQVTEKLDHIINILERLTGTGRYEAVDDSLDDMFGEDPVFEDEVEVISPRMPGITRKVAEYRAVDNTTKTIPLEQLDPMVLRVIEVALAEDAMFFLYERDNGTIAISTEAHIATMVRNEGQNNRPDTDTGR